MNNFHVGQRVVCIAKGWVPYWADQAPAPELPREGNVYTIREIYAVAPPYSSLLLAEIPSGHTFASHGFRPVIERKTDIGVFEALLLRKDARAPELV